MGNVFVVSKLIDFTGKIVLITGGSSGIGAGIARRYSEAGATVAVTYFSNRDEENAREMMESGIIKKAVKLDQRSIENCYQSIKEVIDDLGYPEVLINDAGIYPKAKTLEMTEDEWDLMIDTNLKGVFFYSQAFARELRRQGSGGSIVNISSINAINPMDGLVHYSSSKAGVDMLTRSLAAEWGSFNIRVNAVAPGLIDAPLLDVNVPGWREGYSSRAPLGRIGQPDDIADACLFLSSPMSRWITGQTLIVDGGVMLAPAYTPEEN